ncbi:MAG: GlmU family protein [Bacteroidota bacterium]|nr:GlmU family protein [Bacteroidota bacterium]MDP4190415.1 GlmU family protein [Bacteroidota bacterium]MDP4194554.1 GlmU family protein [Bacteroidota bacterium]
MQLCIFEDIYYDRLEPLIFSRPTYDLICGINSLRAKILRAYPDLRYTLHCRQYLEPLVKSKNPSIDVNKIEDDECLFVNGRILAPTDMMNLIPLIGKENKLYLNKETIIAARVSGKKLKELKTNLFDLLSMSDFDGIPTEQVEIKHIDYIWDLINNNRQQIQCDYQFLMRNKDERLLGKIHPGAHIIEKDQIFIDSGAEVKPGAVLDASNGPIYIDKNATINANSVLEDAVYIGEGSQVKSCARIYDNVSVGKVCKIGGEIEDSIILPFTNKQHSGFLGHAYLGSWVNLGADTNCSDLKNNYGFVRVYVNGEIIDSGSQFLGVIMGDHTKTAINTMFNTGTIVGYSCNIFGPGFPAKYIPSFSWGGSEAVTTYDILRSIETAKRAMLRRDYVMTESDEKLFKKIFDLTTKERRKRGYPY